MKNAITYYRVSTGRQGASGLGLEAQRQAVQEFAGRYGFNLTSEFIEVESTRKRKRPLLAQALIECKNRNATLLIARLDRLARNVAFISALMEAKVNFRAVDNPDATKFMLHITAVVAEHERDLISQRTKDALRIAKQKGVVLGKHGRDVLSKANKQEAKRFALALSPLLDELRQKGITKLHEIARELNRRQVPTSSKKGKWHISTVHNVLKRIRERNKALDTDE